LTNCLGKCYSINRILEVFAVYEATKTFDFVAFFICRDLLRFESEEKEGKGNGTRNCEMV
jgi:hypothetical protein